MTSSKRSFTRQVKLRRPKLSIAGMFRQGPEIALNSERNPLAPYSAYFPVDELMVAPTMPTPHPLVPVAEVAPPRRTAH
jgi:hypothetical protein